MAKLTRVLQKIFGSAAGTNQIAQFGSLAGGTPTFTTDPAVVQGLAEFTEGWFSAVLGNNSPAIEDMNALHFVLSRQLAYIFQAGIPEWDASTTYYQNSLVQSGQFIYQSLTDNNTGNAVTDFTNWRIFSSGSASALDLVEQKNEIEPFGPITDELDNSVATGFVDPPRSYQFQGILLQAYTAGQTQMLLAWGPPQVLNPADKNTTGTTNWSLDVNAVSLTTTATAKVGASAIKFTKTSGGTTSGIVYDAGAPILGFNGYTRLYFWLSLSSASDVTGVNVIIDIDGTNAQKFVLTTTATGGAIASGYNLFFVDISTGGTALGTGWNPSLAARFARFQITTGSSSTVPDVFLNGIFFSAVTPEQMVPPGTEMEIFDSTNVDDLIIDFSNTQVDGPAVVLHAALANSYAGGFGFSSMYRSSLTLGDGQGLIGPNDPNGNTLAGAITLLQSMRISRVLRSTFAGATVGASISALPQQAYKALSVTGSQIVVDDQANQSANLLSGDVVHVFRTIYDDGKAYFVYRGDMTLTGNSTALGGQTTLPGTPPAGTVATDMVVKKVLAQAKLSCVNIGANENFQNMTPSVAPDGIQLLDTGFQIPGDVAGYWSLGGAHPYRNLKGSMIDFSQVGSISNNDPFLQGQQASVGWAAGNYLTILNGAATAINAPANLTLSIWFKATLTPGIEHVFVSMYSGTANGWEIGIDSSLRVFLTSGGGGGMSGGLVSLGSWHHLAVTIKNSVASGAALYLDGALVATNTTTLVATSNDLEIGRDNQGSIFPFSGGSLAQFIAVKSIWSPAQVSQVFNSGRSRIPGFNPKLKYQYETGGVTGQRLSLKSKILTDTTAILPSITQMGAIKVR